MPVDYKKIGIKIGFVRNRRGYSQEELADKTNLTREFINKIEAATKRPSLDTLIRISNALQVSIDDLLPDELRYDNHSELHHLLIECTPKELRIITRTAQELKKILDSMEI